MSAALRVIPVACLRDNYAYLLESKGQAVVIDPSEAPPVRAALARERLTLSGIWLTHHHYDHVGGVEALCDADASLPVLGSAYDLEHRRIPRQSRGLREGDSLDFAGQPVTVIEIPGHTLGAIAYLVAGYLFSGDTLFAGGCGRVFEGTMPMMQASLGKLRVLAGTTRLCCGHEYTVSNLRFALSVEPESLAIRERLDAASGLRERGEPTVPSLLSQERATNPFLRWDEPGVIAAARARGAADDSAASVFGALRAAKDRF